jgi:hypothetical protein
VVVIEGGVTAISRYEIEPAVADARTEEGEYVYFVVRPQTIQVWRGASGLLDRVVMQDGQWLGPRHHAT